MNTTGPAATRATGGEEEVSTLLRTKGLRKQYGSTQALAGLDLELAQGRILGLLGPNGSGKSTLLKIAAGVVHPSSGEIEVLGRRPGRQTKGQVAYLPEVDCLYPEMTARATLAYFATFYPDWDEAKAAELLDFMAIDAKARVGSLSRGMRARLKLVVALARQAKLVLLDEPLSGIDPSSRSRIVQAIVGQYRPESGSLIISTHEVIQAESAFDEVVFLEHGTVRLAGGAEDLRAQHGKSLEALFEEVYA